MQILNKRCIKKLAKYRKIGFKKKRDFMLNAAATISNRKNIKVESINSTLQN